MRIEQVQACRDFPTPFGFLKANQTALILDFERDQTHVVVATADGPLFADRLTAIRVSPWRPDAKTTIYRFQKLTCKLLLLT